MSIVKKTWVKGRPIEIKQVNDILYQLWVDDILVFQSMNYDEVLEKYNWIDEINVKDHELLETLEKVYSVLNGE